MSSLRREQPRSIETILEDLREARFPKLDELLGKIFSAPPYKNLPLLEREAAVLDYLSQNRDKWHGMLVQEGMFSGQTPENMHAISIRCTIERCNRQLVPILVEEVRKLDLRFVEILKNTEGLSETLPLDLIDIEIRALKKLSGRAALRGPLEIIRSDLVERYTPAIDEANGVAAKAALGPLKKRLNLREINHCIKCSLLLKNAIYLASNAESAAKTGFTAPQIQAAIRGILNRYPRVPGFLLKMALYANLSPETAASAQINIPPAARLVSLFAELGFQILSANNNQDGLQELESTLWSDMREKLGDEQKNATDGKLLEELLTIAEKQSW